MFFLLEFDSQSHQKKNANILAENTDLHIIHRHLHTEFKRLYLQVCKINSVIYCNCVPIQYPVHSTNEIHNTFKDHVPEDGRWQSEEGAGELVILPGSGACLVWLQCERGKLLPQMSSAEEVCLGGSHSSGVCSVRALGAKVLPLPRWKISQSCLNSAAFS